MRVLIIPDVHLKPRMFARASEILKEKKAEKAVCLMDIPDDWRQQFNLDLYMQTFDAAIDFAKAFPETLWCWGNHELSYLWQQKVSGQSPIAARTVCEKLRILRETLPDEGQLQFLHRIDNVLFSHGGLAEEFVRKYVPAGQRSDVNAVIDTINGFGFGEMWEDLSPIWYRPQLEGGELYASETLLQVVGHTPVRRIIRKGKLLSCDVFSTDRAGRPFGTREFPVIDTLTCEWEGIAVHGLYAAL